LRTDYLVRSAGEWQVQGDRNPLPEEATRDPGHLIVLCLEAEPALDAVEAVQAAPQGPEIVRADGKQLCIGYRAGIGRSKLTTSLIERRLGTRATGRNWNTVLKIAKIIRG
jgi:uncharacterized protein (DUF1697 family)